MEINSQKNETPEILEFLNIYPPLSPNNVFAETQKYLIYFYQIQAKSKSMRKSIVRKSILSKNNLFLKANNNVFLIDKAIEQQKNNLPRSQDIKEALKSFLYHTNLISKWKKYFSENYSEFKDIYAHINISNLEENIRSVISKLSEHVIVEKYQRNQFVLRMNEIGTDCYFLISGKISILKPVEYKDIRISYKDYLKYLINLYYNKESDLLKKVITINDNFLKFHSWDKIFNNLDEIKIFVKSYCITKLNYKLKHNLINYRDLHLLEEELKEFGFTFADYNIDLKKMEQIIKKMTSNKYVDKEIIDKKVKKYIFESLEPSEDDIYNMLPYDYLFNELLTNNIIHHGTATLFKYELFLYLYPGELFGETALENSDNNRRNATIRTEEECNIISLNRKLYNSILYDSTRIIKELDLLLLKKNYFFNGIHLNIFNKLYYPMFKILNKYKNDDIFHQKSELKSIYFLREGEIKLEAYLSANDMSDIIKYFVEYMVNNKKNFKLNNEQIDNLKKIYLNDKDIINERNKGMIYKEKIDEINKYEIYTTKNPDCLGILEFSSLMNNYIFSCYIISKNAKLYEINKENLKILLRREKFIIQEDYYKLIKNKILILIKRFHSLKLNYLSQINYKINQNFFYIDNNILNNSKNFILDNYNNSNESKEKENNHDIIFNIKSQKNIKETFTQNTNYLKTNTNSFKNNNLYMKYMGNFNYDYNKNNNWSPVALKGIKYNEKFFINKNSNKRNNANYLNKTEYINYNDVIKTLISLETKKSKLKKNRFKSHDTGLKLKNIINIGNNHFCTLKKLKEEEKKNKISESMFNLSIVKYDINKTINSFQSNKNKIESYFLLKNRLLNRFNQIRLRKKFILIKKENSNNTIEKNISNNANDNNYIIINCKKNFFNKNN